MNPVKELEEYLQTHPHLLSLQDRLSREMGSVPEDQRINVLVRYLRDNLDELTTELELLNSKLRGLNHEMGRESSR